MPEIFFISDTHFSDKPVYKIRKKEMRLDIGSSKDLDEHMIELWNATVTRKDTVYHLGDVLMEKTAFKLLKRLNGKKILIKGNHDEFKTSYYYDIFKEIHGIVRLEHYFLSHVPIHPYHIPGWCRQNIHGHIHDKLVTTTTPRGKVRVDDRYANVSVEHLSFKPISIDEIDDLVDRQSASKI